MTEAVGNPGEFERRDPELEAISDQLGALSAEFGFVETPAVAAARAAFLRGVPAGEFDRENPEHRALLNAFSDAAEATMDPHNPGAFKQIGYQVALARLWFEADDPGRFYDRLDLDGESGVVEMLQQTPGGEEYRDMLYTVLDQLAELNDH